MNVIITEAGLSNMVEIGQWIKKGNPNRAESFVEELHTRCKDLGTIPFAFPLLPGREESGIRRRRHEDYLIFYRVEDDKVTVLHVLHGAQDYNRILFPDD